MEKYNKLVSIIEEMESVIVAYSGGVDSSLLAKVSFDVLGDKALAVSARSGTYPESEYQNAITVAKEIGIEHRTIFSNEMDIEGFVSNPPDRCFYCKGELFGMLSSITKEGKYHVVCDGSNLDDLDDHRPGRDAAKKEGVASPLIDAGMTKDDVRFHAKRLGLSNWEKPAAACLASRFPYGTMITMDNLKKVEEAEEILKAAGFSQVRLRVSDETARIELSPDKISEFASHRDILQIVESIKNLGFKYVTLDMEGYRRPSAPTDGE